MRSLSFAAVAALALASAALDRPALAAPDPDELECLALNVYWEARAEDVEDQIAVAHVTLNRVASEGFPDTICDVVRQGGEGELHKCQFSWWCDGRPDMPTNAVAWRLAGKVARWVLSGRFPDPTGGALYFHSTAVRPSWASALTQTVTIGRHHYYR